MSHWFTCLDEDIKGPYSTDQLKEQLEGGAMSQEVRIWGKPQRDWLTPTAWLKNLSKNKAPSSPIVGTPKWHYAYEGSSVGPLTETSLISALKELERPENVLLWSKGMKNWESIFEFPDYIDAVGCVRREHPRAKIEGSVVIKIDGQTAIAKLKTISVGGFGMANVDSSLAQGTEIDIEIKSPRLFESIQASAKIQYVNDDGFVGAKFSKIHMESQAMIIEFVRSAITKKSQAA